MGNADHVLGDELLNLATDSPPRRQQQQAFPPNRAGGAFPPGAVSVTLVSPNARHLSTRPMPSSTARRTRDYVSTVSAS